MQDLFQGSVATEVDEESQAGAKFVDLTVDEDKPLKVDLTKRRSSGFGGYRTSNNRAFILSILLLILGLVATVIVIFLILPG